MRLKKSRFGSFLLDKLVRFVSAHIFKVEPPFGIGKMLDGADEVEGSL